MATKLRLLLDECLSGPLAEQIKQHRSLNVEHVNDTPLGNQSTPDTAIVDYARKTNRIVVTPEQGIDEKKFIICTHPGIVVFRATKRHSHHLRMFRDLMASGQRIKCRHAFTYLSLEETSESIRTIATFRERDQHGKIQETTIDLTRNVVLGNAPKPFVKPKCES